MTASPEPVRPGGLHGRSATEAYLSGNPEKDEAIVKLSPGKQGSNAAYNYVEELQKRNNS
ncbi:hypothetical protein ACIQVC_31110 [Streptomyces sp. NPDC101112]|uniref:hypothetical protein n=1 Tax=Streptomyces sp. NPDC101112 TaxID=3366105 RepID=UPI0038043CBA